MMHGNSNINRRAVRRSHLLLAPVMFV